MSTDGRFNPAARIPRKLIIDGAIWEVIDRLSGCGFYKVRLVDDPEHVVWFDLYMHQVSELDGPGVLQALAGMGEDQDGGVAADVQPGTEGPLDY